MTPEGELKHQTAAYLIHLPRRNWHCCSTSMGGSSLICTQKDPSQCPQCSSTAKVMQSCEIKHLVCRRVQTHTLLAVPSFFNLGCANSSFMPVFALVTACRF